MNKSLKGIIAGCGVLAVLGGVLAVLKLTENPETEPESSVTGQDAHSDLLWDIDSSESISRIEVKKPDGSSYAVNRKMEKDVTSDYQTGEASEIEVANYYLEGYEALPMDTTGIRLLATRSYSVNAAEKVEENPSDLTKYGLDHPTEVTFTTDNNGVISFTIGDATPDQSAYYTQVKGNSTVYTLAQFSAEPFLKDALDYLGKEVTQELPADSELIVKSVRLARKDLDYDIYLVYDSYYDEHNMSGSSALHVMQEPLPCLLNVDKSSKITHGIFGLTASEVICPLPTAEQLTEYGFDDPFATVTVMTDDDRVAVFRLGNTYEAEDADGKKITRYYGYLEGVECVYGFSPDDIEYDNVRAEDITARVVLSEYVWDLSSVVYQAGDLKLSFSGKGTDQKDYVLTKNGEKQESDELIERYRLLYSYLLKTAAEDLILEEVTLPDTPMATVEVRRQDGAHSTDIAFYDAGGMKAYIVVNGTVRYRCRRSYVETLIHNLEIYDTDEPFTMSW